MDYTMEPVTAVMITGRSPTNYKLANTSIELFRAQTYHNRTLLIINDGEALNPKDNNIKEVCMPKQHSLGMLRNIALDLIDEGQLVCQWDDDDYYPPYRLNQQMTYLAISGKEAVTYAHQTIYSFPTRSALYYTSDAEYGIEGTIIHRNTKVRYPDCGLGEDTEFIKQFDVAVIDNDEIDYVKFFHGDNAWHESKMMRGITGQYDKWLISDNHKRCVEDIIFKHYNYFYEPAI